MNNQEIRSTVGEVQKASASSQDWLGNQIQLVRLLNNIPWRIGSNLNSRVSIFRRELGRLHVDHKYLGGLDSESITFSPLPFS